MVFIYVTFSSLKKTCSIRIILLSEREPHEFWLDHQYTNLTSINVKILIVKGKVSSEEKVSFEEKVRSK